MEFINKLKPNTSIKETYLCKSKLELPTKAGKPYYDVTLSDKTGSIKGKIWDITIIPDFGVNDFITVSASVIVYNDALQLTINEVEKAENVNLKNYLACSKYSEKELAKALNRLIQSVETPCFNLLLRTIFKDDLLNRFLKHPAAKTLHHAMVGGLAQHTIDVAGYCSDLSEIHPGNRDLVVTAALLHDIGKLEEIGEMPCNNYITKGRLLGHITIGAIMISEYIRQIRQFSDFPETEEQELLHCILSHHGKFEYGSPVKPMLKEAVMLSYADETDAKLEGFMEGIRSGNVDKDGWTGWSQHFNSYLKQTASKPGCDDDSEDSLVEQLDFDETEEELLRKYTSKNEDDNLAEKTNHKKKPAGVVPFKPKDNEE